MICEGLKNSSRENRNSVPCSSGGRLAATTNPASRKISRCIIRASGSGMNALPAKLDENKFPRYTAIPQAFVSQPGISLAIRTELVPELEELPQLNLKMDVDGLARSMISGGFGKNGFRAK